MKTAIKINQCMPLYYTIPTYVGLCLFRHIWTKIKIKWTLNKNYTMIKMSPDDDDFLTGIK